MYRCYWGAFDFHFSVLLTCKCKVFFSVVIIKAWLDWRIYNKSSRIVKRPMFIKYISCKYSNFMYVWLHVLTYVSSSSSLWSSSSLPSTSLSSQSSSLNWFVSKYFHSLFDWGLFCFLRLFTQRNKQRRRNIKIQGR